jgi:steroid delta-isomerase-like uncharacterized protein
MSDANKALVRRFYEAVNAGNLDVVDELIADDMVEHDEFPGLEPNKAGVRKFFETMRAAFPDCKLVEEDMVAEGDTVFVRARVTGTHRGEFLGIPATNRAISVPMVDMVRLANGQCVEHWGVTDTGAMMEQLTGG